MNVIEADEKMTIPADLIQDALEKKGEITLRMHSTSMNPLLSPDKRALVRLIGNEKISLGDILCFKIDSNN